MVKKISIAKYKNKIRNKKLEIESSSKRYLFKIIESEKFALCSLCESMVEIYLTTRG